MLAVPVAVAVSVPASSVTWLESPQQAISLEPVMSMGDIDREAALGRGSVDRTPAPRPSQSPLPPVATPDVEPNEDPDDETDDETDEEPDDTEEVEDTPEPDDEPDEEPTAVGQMFTVSELNVRSGPARHTTVVAVLAAGTEVEITGNTDGDWVQILHGGGTSWVNGDYLSETEPSEEDEDDEAEDTPDDGISYPECSHGTSIESGLTQDAIRVYRAVCARYPDVSSYGGYRSGGGAHSQGRAVDIMVRGSLGDSIAEWVRANHRELGVSEVIWAQRIWTVQRSSEGWRWMSDRGSDTANHYDHVHVTVYGNSGG
ncbi:SH3 domain-containing protein [Phytoactinopolyspora limicola]|uniref:SH3 domain-containing protein n=1 Tax=Phytoactinopolyspora limicola TaxID=2715536 RepID=UPI001408F0B3|nr:SH3 domain-containing protein [Phytoactinopolyspora limicola]